MRFYRYSRLKCLTWWQTRNQNMPGYSFSFLLWWSLYSYFFCRFELRADRKRESCQAVSLLQSTKQEILSIIQEFKRASYPQQTGGYQGHSPQSNSQVRGQISDRGHMLSSNDLEQLKEDIISGICSRLQDNLQPFQGVERLPSIDSDLYTTHLYTQL